MIPMGLAGIASYRAKTSEEKLRTCVYSRYAILTLIEATGVEVKCSRSGLAVDASPRRDKLIFELMRRMSPPIGKNS